MAPVERRDNESYEDLWENLKASGFARARVDGTSIDLDAPPKLSRRRMHRVEVVVDRATIRRARANPMKKMVASSPYIAQGVAKTNANPGSSIAGLGTLGRPFSPPVQG